MPSSERSLGWSGISTFTPNSLCAFPRFTILAMNCFKVVLHIHAEGKNDRSVRHPNNIGTGFVLRSIFLRIIGSTEWRISQALPVLGNDG